MPGIPGFLDLVHVLASFGRMEADWNTPGFTTISEEIGSGGILVFVLVDGMGESILGRLGRNSFLARHRRHSLEAVFPSTTACAMTSLATALSPAGHGIPGRTMCLSEHRLHLHSLSFRAVSDNSPVTMIPSTRIWPFPSLFRGAKTGQATVLPRMLIGSPFARYLCGQDSVNGYSSIHDAVDTILRAERESRAPACLFLYLWDLDSLCHEKGPGHEDSLALLRLIDVEMERLARGIGEGSRLVISADHGQIDVDAEDRFVLGPGHPLLDHLVTIPYGEPRAAQFLVKAGHEDAFRMDFERILGERFSLLNMDSVEAFALFGGWIASGGGSFSPIVRRNMGDFMALARGKSLLLHAKGTGAAGTHRGEHGGNLPDERLVPLIVT